MHSEMVNIRIGKLITPIGYWNLEPINVLRDTSSNPEYSNKIFPKLLTGIDIYGYIDDYSTFKYHFFMQQIKDFDLVSLNLAIKNFILLSLEYNVDFSMNNVTDTFYNLHYNRFNNWLYNQVTGCSNDMLVYLIQNDKYYLLPYNDDDYTVPHGFLKQNMYRKTKQI